MELTDKQIEVLARMRAAGMYLTMASTEAKWRAGEPYYIDSREKCPRGLRSAFKEANPRVDHIGVVEPDFRVTTPQEFRGMGGTRVAVFKGRCVVCNCRTYCYEDESHPDPRGALGYHTSAALQAASMGMIGSDVPLCWQCSNDRTRAALAQKIATARWKIENDAFVATQVAEGKHAPGSVSHATMLERDVLPAIVAELEVLRPETATSLKAEAEEITGLPWMVLKCGPGKQSKFGQAQVDAAWMKDGMSELTWETAFKAMDEITPDKHYFGAHPGDGSDFGFWLSEEDF